VRPRAESAPGRSRFGLASGPGTVSAWRVRRGDRRDGSGLRPGWGRSQWPVGRIPAPPPNRPRTPGPGRGQARGKVGTGTRPACALPEIDGSTRSPGPVPISLGIYIARESWSSLPILDCQALTRPSATTKKGLQIADSRLQIPDIGSSQFGIWNRSSGIPLRRAHGAEIPRR